MQLFRIELSALMALVVVTVILILLGTRQYKVVRPHVPYLHEALGFSLLATAIMALAAIATAIWVL